MTKNMKILAGLLGAQIVLVALSFMGAAKMSPPKANTPFMAVNLGDINQITIEEENGLQMALKKKENTWVLPDAGDFPASKDKLEELIRKITDIKVTWPVGQTKIAAKQLKTVEGSFEKKIAFHKGDKVEKTLFLGTSPGLKQIHARAEGTDQTYVVLLNAYEWSTNARDWLDKKYYELPRDNVSRIKLPGFTLVNEANEFKLEGLKDVFEMDAAKVNPIVTQLIDIDFEDLLGTQDKKEYGLGTPAFTFTVETKGNEAIIYALSGPYEKEYTVLKISKYPYYFKVRMDETQEFRQKKKDDLIKIKEKKEEAPAGE